MLKGRQVNTGVETQQVKAMMVSSVTVSQAFGVGPLKFKYLHSSSIAREADTEEVETGEHSFPSSSPATRSTSRTGR